MIEFALSLASFPQILTLALLLVLIFSKSSGRPAIEFEMSFARFEPGPCLQAGETMKLVPGTEVKFQTRFGLPFALACAGIRRFARRIFRGVLISVVAVLAAIGLHILVGIASALLALPAAMGPPRPVERSASWLVPAAVDGEALLRSQIVLLRSLSPTKGPAGTYAPLDVGAAVAEAMRRAATTR